MECVSQLPWLKVGASVAAVSIATWLLLRRLNQRPQRYIQNYETDKVYFFQFPSCQHIVNISPFAVKVETFLRLYKIPYETIPCLNVWSAKGQIPFIELNGEQYAESNAIIELLKQKFSHLITEELSISEQATFRAFAMMLENQTVLSYFFYRYAIEVKNFIATWQFVGPIFKLVLVYRFPKGFRHRTQIHGIGRNTDQEIVEIGQKDFLALSQYLGDKKYFFGNDHCTTMDCYAFGHLAQVLDIPEVNYPHREFIVEHCPNLLTYYQRIKQQLWSDWEEVCQRNLVPRKL